MMPGDKEAAEIADKISMWERGCAPFLEQYDVYANYFKMDPPAKSDKTQSFTRTRVPETPRAVMALATSIFRMLTVSDPNIEILKIDPSILDSQLLSTQALLLWQNMKLKKRRKLFKALQGLTLFGTQVVEEPWKVCQYGDNEPEFEGTDFVPRSLLQFAFDPGVPEMELSDFYVTLDYMTPDRLRGLAKTAPETWDGEAIEEAISNAGSAYHIPDRVKFRRERAGYNFGLPAMEVATYYGNLSDVETDDGREWIVSIVNGTKVVRAHSNPFPGGRPFRISHYVEFELEPYGLGVGQFGRLGQKQLDGNRGRTSDLITSGLLNMYLVSKLAGISSSSFKFKPNGIIEGDDISENSIRALRPLIEAAGYGIQLDNILKGEFQGVTGATPNLQAVTSDSTATESSIAQNEALRRISVHSEIIGDEFIREHTMNCHKNNMAFLDRSFWIAFGDPKPRFISKRYLARDIEVMVKIATDKDFRPNRVAQLINFVTLLTSIRNNIPAEIDVIPMIKEAARAQGIDPAKIIKALPPPPPPMSDQLTERMAAMQALAEQAPGIPGSQNEPGQLMSPQIPEAAGPGLISTGVGTTLGTP